MEERQVKRKEEKEILGRQKKEPQRINRIRDCREANISGFGAQGVDHQ